MFVIKYFQMYTHSICTNYWSQKFCNIQCIIERTMSHPTSALILDTETPQSLPLAPPSSSPIGVGKCTIVYIVLAAVILWVAALGIALYTLK